MGTTRLARTRRAPLVLAVDLSRPVSDASGGGALSRLLTAKRPALRRLVETIDEAADDPRVRVLLARVDRPAESWAHAEEVRAAVERFRKAGKPAIAHAQTFGEFADGTLAYYVAASFGEVHLQPSGGLGLLGISSQVPFVADMLAKLDVVAEVDHRHEYKSAANLLTEREFTDAHREAVDRIVASHHERLVAAVAEGRAISGEDASALIDRGPLLAGEALERGLVDRLAYRDEASARAKELAGDGARLLTDAAYRSLLRRRRLVPRRRTTVALVHGEGGIQVGRDRRGPLGPVMGSDSVVSGLHQAIRDRRVRAVLFRVDSPGGSAVASDAIWRAVVRAREAGKPVIVSMGSVAGSGGYWVSMAADRIVAQPGTLTGSIGVVTAKLVTRGLRQRLGITTDEAHRGEHALLHSRNHRYSESHWERVTAELDEIYDEFLDKVGDGRGMTREQVHELARGRVWTGADAAERGLVDELGGYREAQDAVRRHLGLDPRAPLRLRSLPRKPLAERLGLRSADFEDARTLLEATGAGLRAAGLRADGVAAMPGWTRSLR